MAHWIFLCAWCNATGWILSALGSLNLGGYIVAMFFGAFLWLACFKTYVFNFGRILSVKRFRRRFGRPFPLLFLFLGLLAIIGGLLYPPTNYDALAYRIPRVLHWLAEDRWHWIHTGFPRLNVRATGFEWMMAPLITFTKTDRWIFLINLVSFLLLPGRVFSTFTRLGVGSRVAWYWMWLLPSGYCFLLQAGSASNDLFGAVFALAAVEFALRARVKKRFSDFALSTLAAALLSAGKSSNAPLLLPWLAAILPTLGVVMKRPLSSCALVVFAASASLLPISVLNAKYTGDWTGLAAEYPQLHKGDPALRVIWNAIHIVEENLTPPVFPFAGTWNDLMRGSIPPNLAKKLEYNFEEGGAHLGVAELQMEEGSGLGFGVSLLVLFSLAGGLLRRNPQPSRLQTDLYRCGLLLAPYGSLLAFMAKSGLSTGARLVAPYYGLLLPLLLVGERQKQIVRKRWWRVSALAVFVVALIPQIVSPARPLWPARLYLAKMDAAHSSNRLLNRAYTVYSVYGERSDGFAPARAALPLDANPLGFISYDDPEVSLWRPFGGRRIEHVTPSDNLMELQRKKIEYVLVSSQRFKQLFTQPFDEWLAKIRGTIVWKMPLTLRASDGRVDWFLVRLPKAA